jgi:long-chain acyl-CoA synthetase
MRIAWPWVLVGRGVKKGDRVVILLENSLEYVVAYYGILKAGAVAVPLSTDLKPDGLNPLLAELEPAAIISSSRFERLLQASELDVPSLNTLIIHNPKLDWNSHRVSIFPFPTSHNQPKPQTTTHNPQTPTFALRTWEALFTPPAPPANPKASCSTHANIVANVDSICQYLQLTDSDIQMVVLPFFYVMGKSLLNTIVAAGGTLVINNKFAFPATVINQMIEEKATLFSGVPSTYAYLLHRSPLKKSKDQFEHLRMVTQAGGHMARSVKTTLRKPCPIIPKFASCTAPPRHPRD